MNNNAASSKIQTHTLSCLTPKRDAGLGAFREGKRKAKTRQGKGKRGGRRAERLGAPNSNFKRGWSDNPEFRRPHYYYYSNHERYGTSKNVLKKVSGQASFVPACQAGISELPSCYPNLSPVSILQPNPRTCIYGKERVRLCKQPKKNPGDFIPTIHKLYI